jgi:hypothetical protein
VALGARFDADRLMPRYGTLRGPQAWAQVAVVGLETSAQRSRRAVERIIIPKRSRTYFAPARPRGVLERVVTLPIAGRPLEPSGRVRDTVVARARYFDGSSAPGVSSGR